MKIVLSVLCLGLFVYVFVLRIENKREEKKSLTNGDSIFASLLMMT